MRKYADPISALSSAAIIAFAWSICGAQESPPPAETTAPQPAVSDSEIEKALSADQAARRKQLAPPTPVPSATPPSGWGAVGRFFQSLNPDLAAILDIAGGYYSDDAIVRNGDDPAKTGFNVQELEVSLQAVVDPYLRADIFLTIPNLGGLEVEEAVVTTTSLPANLQVRAGIFRADIGRQNPQHLHLQDFTRRPVSNALFLGVDGLRAPGLEINWLVPRIPFYLLLSASAFSVEPAEADQPLQTFGGGARYDFAYLGTARLFFPLGEATSLFVSGSYAHGKTSQLSTQNPRLPAGTTAPTPTAYDNWYDNLYSASTYLKWKPPNTAVTYASIAWTTEYFLRHIPDLVIAGVRRPQLEGGLYSQIVIQMARRWFLGLRGEVLGIPSGDNVTREYGAATSLTLFLSEFFQMRAYGEARFPAGRPAQGTAFLQLQAAIGAHGAHPF